MSKLNCPLCDQQLTSVDAPNNSAKCKSCSKTYEVDKLLLNEYSHRHKNAEKPKDGIEEFEIDGVYTMNINWRPFSNWQFRLLFIAILMIFVLVFGAIAYFDSGIVISLVTLLFIAVTVMIIYDGFIRFFNHTEIKMDQYDLWINHRFPYYSLSKIQELDLEEINQVYIKRKDGGSNGKKKLWQYTILIKLKNKSSLTIINSIHSYEVACYIESALQNKLGIVDEIIHDEYHPDRPAKYPLALHRIRTKASLEAFRKNN